MPKENLVELANTFASRLWKRSASQNLPQTQVSEISSIAILNRLGLSWLPSQAVGFYLNSKQVKILHEPQSFYRTLLEKCCQANRRIVLASLYFGTSALEANLISTINQTLIEKPGLQVKVLLDCTRGTRGEMNSRKMLLPLLENHQNSCQVSLYQTPELQGSFLSFLPQKYKEVIGLQHIKVYLFDNDLIISGANLSKDYFTMRQDRYIVIQDCKELADFIEGLVDRVSECSLQLDAHDSLSLHHNWQYHPATTSPQTFNIAAHNHIWSYYKQHVGFGKMYEYDDTVIFPLLEMGPFNIHLDSQVTTRILQDSRSLLHLATGYFNLTDAYTDTIINKSKATYYILTAHPTANGFFEAEGPARGIPHAYTALATRFLKKVRSAKEYSRIKVFEYQRPGWTYHAKGLWLTPEDSQSPCLTLIGSPNFGERSVNHDLECQFLLATTDNLLQEQLLQERDVLYHRSLPFTEEVAKEPDRQTPVWVKVVLRLFRTYL